MKILFMGTPDFAAGILKSLISAGHEITAVVTQPDRAKGRSGAPVFSPVKEVAVENNIPVLQPERIKLPEEPVFDTYSLKSASNNDIKQVEQGKA